MNRPAIVIILSIMTMLAPFCADAEVSQDSRNEYMESCQVFYHARSTKKAISPRTLHHICNKFFDMHKNDSEKDFKSRISSYRKDSVVRDTCKPEFGCNWPPMTIAESRKSLGFVSKNHFTAMNLLRGINKGN